MAAHLHEAAASFSATQRSASAPAASACTCARKRCGALAQKPDPHIGQALEADVTSWDLPLQML